MTTETRGSHDLTCDMLFEQDCSKYALLENLRDIVQHVLRTADCNLSDCCWTNAGLVEVLERIFSQGLLPGYGQNQDIQFPGFLSVLQWCLESNVETGNQRSTIHEIQQTVCMCSKSGDASDNKVMKILLDEVPLNAIINLLQDTDLIDRNYQSNAFMKNNVCCSSLLTCLKAIHFKSTRILSELPLPVLRHSFKVVLGIRNERVHREAHLPPESSTRASTKLQENVLPDVVACTKASERNISSYNFDYTIAINDDDSSADLKDDAIATPKHFNELVEDEPHSDHCSQENAQLHLSELLITVIQGRNCGLSNPDLLECVNKVVPKMPSHCEEALIMEQTSSSIISYCESAYSRMDNTQSTDEESMSGLDSGQLQWCVPLDEVPQSLLPTPDSLESSRDRYPDKPNALLDLSPIITISRHSLPKKQALASQKYKCFGCGLCLQDSRGGFRYCEVFKYYFCRNCHDNKTKRLVPARIFYSFDFKRYKVSKVASNLLDEIHCEPVFNLDEINPNIYHKSKSLATCQELRRTGSNLLKRLESCPLPWQNHKSVLMQKLNSLPLHMLRGDLFIYSLSDLTQVKSGLLCKQLNAFVEDCLSHTQVCNLCSKC